MLVNKLKEFESSVRSKILCGLYLKEGEKVDYIIFVLRMGYQ